MGLLLAGCDAGGARVAALARLPTATPTPERVYETPPEGGYLTVSGDTLSEIADRFGYDTAELARYNGIAHPNRIGIGHRLLFSRSFEPPPAGAIEVGYTGNYSGGSFRVLIDEKPDSVRLGGIDVLESYAHGLTACVDEGSELRLHSFLHERDLRLVTDLELRDDYGTLSADIFVGSIYLNEYLVREGHAYVSLSAGMSAFQSDLVAAQQLAMEERKGMWGRCPETEIIERLAGAEGIDYAIGYMEFYPAVFHLADPNTGDLLHSATRVSVPDGVTWYPSVDAVVFETPYRYGYRKMFRFFDGGGVIAMAGTYGLGPPLPSPDGNWIAYAGWPDYPIFDLHLARADGTGSRLLMRSETGWDDLTWAPDGSALVFGLSQEDSPDGVAGLFVIEVPGGAVRRLTSSPLADRSPDWSPDGAEIAFERVSRREPCESTHEQYCRVHDIQAVIVATGATRFVTGGTEEELRDPRWSPDGSRIAFIVVGGRAGRAGLYYVGRDGEPWQRVLAGNFGRDVPVWSPDGRYLTFGVRRASSGRSTGIIRVVDAFTGELSVVASGSVCCAGWYVPPPPRAEGAFPASIAPKMEAAVDLIRSQTGEVPELGRLLGYLHQYPDRVTFAPVGPSAGGFYDFLSGVIYMKSESWATENDVFAAMLLHELAFALDHRLGRLSASPDCFDTNLRAVNLPLDFWEALWGPDGKPDDDHPFAVWLNDRLWERTAAPLAFRDEAAAKYPYLCEDQALYYIPWGWADEER